MVDNEGTTAVIPDLNAPDGDPTDPGGWGARFLASLDLQLGKITTAQEATTAELRKLRAEGRGLPAITKISSVFTFSTAATAGICQQGGTGFGVQIGGPEVGRQWNVRQITVMGTTLLATPAGVAWFLTAPAPPTEQSPTSVVDWTKAALPSNSFYGTSDWYIGPNDNLWMIVTGGGNGVQYVASVTIQESAFIPRRTDVEL